MAYYNYSNNGGGGIMGWFRSLPDATKNIFIINVLVFIATYINETRMVMLFAMFVPTSPYFHVWQPITYMFMHGGIFHILFNMYTLLMFGAPLERALGTKKFTIFYFVCGIGAAIIHAGVQYLLGSAYLGIPMVGASGAIYGILIGFAMFYPETRLTLIFPPVTLKAKSFVWIFVGIELFTGVTGTVEGVAHFAHLGGMLFGFLLLQYWKKSGKLWN